MIKVMEPPKGLFSPRYKPINSGRRLKPGQEVIGKDRFGQDIYAIHGRAEQIWIVTSGTYAVPTTVKGAIELTTSSVISNSWVGFDVTFDGVTSTAVPATISLATLTASGTGTAITFAAAHRANVSAQYNPVTTAKVNMTTAGTGEVIVCQWFCHPQAGMVYQFPLGREFGMGASMWKQIKITAPAAVNAIANLWFSE